MRTLFSKFLLWFWLGLAVLLGVELVSETHTLKQGLEVRDGAIGGPLAMYADLARATLAGGGLGALDSLGARLGRDAAVTAFRIDSLGAGPEGQAVPLAAREAGLAVLRQSKSVLMESPDGFFLGYPLGRFEGRRYAFVLHRSSAADGREEHEARAWPPFLPFDLVVRSLVLLVLGGIACYLLARYITAPVIRLRHATQRLAEGDLDARVGSPAPGRRDELEDLGRDFDRMAERLGALLGAQRRLLSDISHELRSPLARMNVALGLMREGGPADVAAMMPRLETEASRLNQLIGDVLTLSRAEAGEPVPAFQRVDLGALVSEVADDARFEAGARVREVRLDCRDRVAAMGTPELLRSAVDNVVRNAVRHTRDGTSVEIVVEQQTISGAATAVIAVRDHGAGVPDDQLERIFEPFYRFEGAAASRAGGTGLGLAIARRVMARHGGGIDAAAAPEGGLLVTIRLPAAAAGS